MKQKLTQDRLKELLDYDPETGIFINKTNRGKKIKKGSKTGHLDKDGYWQICIDYKNYRAHRLVFLYMEGYLPENGIDHIDRNKLNNRRNNLREVSQTCNRRNCNIYKANKSGVTGVCWYKRDKKWEVSIRNFGKKIFCGYFENIIDAAKARWEAEVKYNFPNCNTTSSAYNYLKDHGAI